MCMSKPSMSQPKATQPTITTTVDDQEVTDAKEKQRRRALMAAGRQSTLLTGESGVSGAANTSQKTLLGQ